MTAKRRTRMKLSKQLYFLAFISFLPLLIISCGGGGGVGGSGASPTTGNISQRDALSQTSQQYIQYKTSYIQQYQCKSYLEKMHPGLGYDLANAGCAQASVTMNASYYSTPGNNYDCSTLNFVQQAYLIYKGGKSYVINSVLNDYLYVNGTDGQVLCNWLNTSGFNVTCTRKIMNVDQLKNEVKNGPVVLGLKPFYYDNGKKSVKGGHYILLRGYDYNRNNDGFVVNDPAGNANVKGLWGITNPGELLSYGSNIINNQTLSFVLVIRKKK
jgi:hypothetical protein